MNAIVVAARSSAKRAAALIGSPSIKPLLVALELDPATVTLSVEPNPDAGADKHSKFLVLAAVTSPIKAVEPPATKSPAPRLAVKAPAKKASKSAPVAKAA
jgi:hypothetical protein